MLSVKHFLPLIILFKTFSEFWKTFLCSKISVLFVSILKMECISESGYDFQNIWKA